MDSKRFPGPGGRFTRSGTSVPEQGWAAALSWQQCHPVKAAGFGCGGTVRARQSAIQPLRAVGRGADRGQTGLPVGPVTGILQNNKDVPSITRGSSPTFRIVKIRADVADPWTAPKSVTEAPFVSVPPRGPVTVICASAVTTALQAVPTAICLIRRPARTSVISVATGTKTEPLGCQGKGCVNSDTSATRRTPLRVRIADKSPSSFRVIEIGW